MQALSSNNPIILHPSISLESMEYKIQRRKNAFFKWNIEKFKERCKGKTVIMHENIIVIK